MKDTTVEILKDIRANTREMSERIEQTNARLDRTTARLDARLEETNVRIDNLRVELSRAGRRVRAAHGDGDHRARGQRP